MAIQCPVSEYTVRNHNQKDSIEEEEFWIEGVLFGKTRTVVRRQGVRDRTSGGEEIDQSYYTLEAKAD